jgi:NADPH-dependent curcumin reductase CurA
MPRDNQMVTRTLYLSLDPYQWGRRRGGAEAVGEVCHGRTVAQVVASRLAGYAEGDFVFNTNGWQRYGLTGDGVSTFTYMFPRKLDPSVAPVSLAVGVLGMLGLTAYAGLVVQCQPKAGETVVVSAASGGVGQVVGQIAKILGCRVVGIAGAQAKCDFVVHELGFDACVSHLGDGLPAALAAACPDGIDVYFENVGGRFAAVLPLLNERSRISLCGMISQYANTGGGNPRDAWMASGAAVFTKRSVEVNDLHVRNFVADYQDRFLAEMRVGCKPGASNTRKICGRGSNRRRMHFAQCSKVATSVRRWLSSDARIVRLHRQHLS